MKCSEIQKQFIQYQEGALSQVDSKQVEDHLQTCEHCQSSYTILERTFRYITIEKEQQAPSFLEDRIVQALEKKKTDHSYVPIRLNHLQKIAAALLVAIGLLGGMVIGSKLYSVDAVKTQSVSEEFNIHNNIGSFEAFLLNQ